ncbi:bifunctional endoribonuclease/protein kinase ire1, partial [Quaeritorhiza haematococci]
MQNEVPATPKGSSGGKKKKKRKGEKGEGSEGKDKDESKEKDRGGKGKEGKEDGYPDGLRSLQVSDQVLGYGSHGTVVYKGTFQSRSVAIKRLLLDFYAIADHEVRILQDSDHHRNVIRYFCRERTDRFMYVALELCQASLADVVENYRSREEWGELRARCRGRRVCWEVMCGIRFLHGLKIVHRDIKPQNILLAEAKGGKKSSPSSSSSSSSSGNGSGRGGGAAQQQQQNATVDASNHPRVLISDFGLCKRLADDQSSFHNTVNTAGGTIGWRAPECILSASHPSPSSSSNPDSTSTSNTESEPSSSSNPNINPTNTALTPTGLKITKKIDIFSAGCVFYYVLTSGEHPFGDRFSREINILKGNFRLDKLDGLGVEGVEAKDLIRRMVAKDPKK